MSTRRDELEQIVSAMAHPTSPAAAFAAAFAIAYDPDARAAWRRYQARLRPTCPHPEYRLGECQTCGQRQEGYGRR